jgi:tryptophan-rich sensory protein
VAPEDRVFNNQGEFKVRYSRRNEIIALAGFFSLCAAVGLSGSGFAWLSLRDWFPALRHPAPLPPVVVLMPVWVTLYAMVAVAGWEIWRVPDVRLRNHRALTAWGWQLGLKAMVTPVFFGLHWLLAAALLSAILLGAVAVTIWRFGQLNRGAALLMLPYFGWVGFSVYLNAGFWWLNC